MLHGGEVYTIARQKGVELGQLLDFSANINPYGMPSGMETAVLEGLKQAVHYPDADCRELAEALALRENIGADGIVCGNGAADLIYRIVYGLKPQKALLIEPTFLEYREALVQGGCEIREYRLEDDFQITQTALEGLLDEMQADLDLMFLCNPNNPTGLLTDREILGQIVKRAWEQGIVLVIDECFLDFVVRGKEYCADDWLEKYGNLIILKSFTKMYALPGIRLGYLMCQNPEYTGKIRKAGQTWSVNCLAQAAGLFALKAEGFADNTADYVAAESGRLKEILKSCGLKVYDGRANFLLFRAVGMDNLYEALLEENIIIRRCCNYVGLDTSYYRIAVRSRKENDCLAEALRRVLGRNE